ncbi:MAG TPA: aldo/keto reductase [Rhizomicrobium sp.]|jgi:aryl-alcohol dehydrogenase-like predicted oxidoreductase|nr:aldo/keto reductase [Rhizomicrobium sp.]
MRNPDARLSRRDAAVLFAGAALSPGLADAAMAQAEKPLLARPIPHGNGETLPAVGVGTSGVFEVGASAQERTGPAAVVQALVDHGGTIIDTAPSYGEAEVVIGDIVASSGLRPKIFIATKLEDYRPGGELAEAQDCLKRLRTSKLDLLQLHNVRNPNQDMGGLNALKARGLCRYTGVTTTFEGEYGAAEAIVRRAKPDFLEIDYAIDNREAEQRLLPAARDAGTGVFVALPFGRGRLFRTALGRKLPDWAAEFDCASWAQFFLKFTLSHPEITAVIPGTDKPAHMIDNLGAARGRQPDAAMRQRMIKYVESL